MRFFRKVLTRYSKYGLFLKFRVFPKINEKKILFWLNIFPTDMYGTKSETMLSKHFFEIDMELWIHITHYMDILILKREKNHTHFGPNSTCARSWCNGNSK